MTMPSTWFISGAGKGIGLGLVKGLLSRADTTVIATTRNGKPTEGLQGLVPAKGSRFILLKLEVSSPTDATDAIQSLRQEHNIEHLDVVWANAGLGSGATSLAHSAFGDLELEHVINVNTYGPIRLLQATLPLLHAAKKPKFVVTSSAVGSVELASKLTFVSPAYGVSKAAINYLLRRLNEQEKDLTVIAIHPGLVATEMGDEVHARTGIPTVSIEDSVRGLLEQVDNASKQTDDRLRGYDNGTYPW